MVSKEVILTQGGLENLEKELEHLKSIKRREVAARIKTAISFGDISENSEYEDAKNEQAFIEGRIITLEKMLRNVRLIDDEETSSEIVSIASTVILRDLEYEEDHKYTIVGSAEANPAESKISNESPVGKAIIGKKINDVVEVSVPAGILKYQIIKIS
ncbi:MAG: transcription elongation factor GreA [Clostridium sp.]|nr:transcription elongation factor GreA [Clostridium sp.]